MYRQCLVCIAPSITESRLLTVKNLSCDLAHLISAEELRLGLSLSEIYCLGKQCARVAVRSFDQSVFARDMKSLIIAR